MIIPFPSKKTIAKKIINNMHLDIPIDPIRIAQINGIQVVEVTFVKEEYAGILSRKESEVKIYLKKSDNAFRKRFVTAHELGHYFLHHGSFLDDFQIFSNTNFVHYQDKRIEEEANDFAFELLLPTEKFKDCWFNSSSLEYVAAKFQVHPSLIEKRLKQLGYSL